MPIHTAITTINTTITVVHIIVINIVVTTAMDTPADTVTGIGVTLAPDTGSTYDANGDVLVAD
jgi:hypothetical protein